MKVLAFNGSPKGPKSNTDYILRPFMEGANQSGAETEIVYLNDKKINHCAGCLTCWVTRKCIQQDDMSELINQLRGADVIVFATPLYVFSMSGLMKDFMDRSVIVLTKADMVKRGEQYTHPLSNEEEWPKKVVLISNAGLPERHHFIGLEETFRTFTSSIPEFEFAGSIFCAAGPLLAMPQFGNRLKWYTDAAKSAGREIVKHGSIMPQTQDVLKSSLMDSEQYAMMITGRFRELSDAFKLRNTIVK